MSAPNKNLVPRLHIFISSPSDVKEERDAAETVIERLSKHPLIEPYFDLRALRWEKSVPSAAMNPQDAVNFYIGQSSKADIVLVIFSGRIGTPYKHPTTGEQFDSGTHYEFMDAYRTSVKNQGFPHVMLYRGLRFTGDHGEDQKARLEALFSRIGVEYDMLYSSYSTVEEFASKFENELLLVLHKWINEKRSVGIRAMVRPTSEVVHDSSRMAFEALLPIFGREETLKKIQDSFATNAVCVSLIGLGGVGKSRVAAEVARAPRFTEGVVWHEITPNSTVEDLTNLLADRIGADRNDSADKIWSLLEKLNVLLVLDNAEDCTDPTVRAGYVKRIKALSHRSGSRILITSRVRWTELQGLPQCKVEELAAPSLEAAVAILNAVYEREQPSFPLDNLQETYVRAAYLHPRIIEQSICWLWDYPVKEVIRQLRTLSSYNAEALISDIVTRTLDLVQKQPNGADAIQALKQMAVARGGFTGDCAAAVVGSTNPLGLLRRYCLLGISGSRYDIHPIILETLTPDEEARGRHYQYFRHLVEELSARQAYAELDRDTVNLDIAFDYALSLEDHDEAVTYFEACANYINNRVQPNRRLSWAEHLVNRLSTKAALLNSTQIVKVHFLHAKAYDSLRLSDQMAKRQRALELLHPAAVHIGPELDPLLHIKVVNWRAEVERDYFSQMKDPETRRDGFLKVLTDLTFLETLETAQLPSEKQLDFQRRLAYAYRIMETLYRRLGQREEEERVIKQAIWIYEAVQVAYRQLGDNKGLMETVNRIGMVYGRLARNESDLTQKRHYREHAIRAYEEAAVLSKTLALLHSHSIHLVNLSSSYHTISHYEKRAYNLSRAIELRLESLQYRTLENAPDRFASTQTVLANLYREYALSQEFEANAQKAIEAARQALQFRNPAVDPIGYAATLHTLGRIYLYRAERQRSTAELHQALHWLKESINHRTERGSSEGYAETNGTLGWVYNLFAELDPVGQRDHLRQGKLHFETAFQWHDKNNDPIEHSHILAGYGNFLRLSELFSGDIAQFEEALKYAQESLQLRQEGHCFDYAAGSMELLGWIYRDMGNCVQALQYLQQASLTYQQMDMPYYAQRAIQGGGRCEE